MNKVTTFYLARHGETMWNLEGRIQGQLDSALTKQGINQAYQLAKLFSELNISQIISSSLNRAIQTAQITAQHLGMNFHVHQGIEERHFGTWQGQLYSDITQHPDHQEILFETTHRKPTNGETAIEVIARFSQSLKNIMKQYGNDCCAVITHGEVLRCFLASLNLPKPTSLNQSSTTANNIEFTNCCLYKLEYHHDSGNFTLI